MINKNYSRNHSPQRILMNIPFYRFISPFFILFFFLTVHCLNAQSSPVLSLEGSIDSSLTDLCLRSENIVEVFVKSQESRIEPEDIGGQAHDVIYTYVTVQVTDVYKGEASAPEQTLRIRGGCVNESCIISPEMPQFTEGEKMILFLKEETGELKICPVVGLKKGQYLVERDADGKEVVKSAEGKPRMGFKTANGTRIGIGHPPPDERDQRRLEMLQDNAQGERKPISKDNFVTAIRNEVQRQQMEEGIAP